jgi:hypothetical protein
MPTKVGAPLEVGGGEADFAFFVEGDVRLSLEFVAGGGDDDLGNDVTPLPFPVSGLDDGAEDGDGFAVLCSICGEFFGMAHEAGCKLLAGDWFVFVVVRVKDGHGKAVCADEFVREAEVVFEGGFSFDGWEIDGRHGGKS